MMTHEEREKALVQMIETSGAFYVRAVHIGNHPFIEFCGLMNEYIKACKEAHDAGIDFTDCSTHTGVGLPIPGHSINYINEKLECIFVGLVVMAPKQE